MDGAEKDGAPHRNSAVQLVFAGLCCHILNVARLEGRIAEENMADRIWAGCMDWRAATACQPARLLVYVSRGAVGGSHCEEAVQSGLKGAD